MIVFFAEPMCHRLLEAGMKVIEIDGTNMENELHEKVVEKLNNAGARINLVVGCPARNSRPPYLNAFRHVRIVQIEKPVNGLGFNIVGGEVDHQGTVVPVIYLYTSVFI